MHARIGVTDCRQFDPGQVTAMHAQPSQPRQGIGDADHLRTQTPSGLNDSADARSMQKAACDILPMVSAKLQPIESANSQGSTDISFSHLLRAHPIMKRTTRKPSTLVSSFGKASTLER